MGGNKVKCSSRMGQRPGGQAVIMGAGGGVLESQDRNPTIYSLSKYILLCVMCVLCSVCLGQSLDSVCWACVWEWMFVVGSSLSLC